MKGGMVKIKRRLTGKFKGVKWRDLTVPEKKESNNNGHEDSFLIDNEDNKKKVVHNNNNMDGLVYPASPLDPS